MSDIYDILKLDKQLICSFQGQGELVCDTTLYSTLEKAQRKFESISNKYDSDAFSQVDSKTIEVILDKLGKCCSGEVRDFSWTSSELRLLSYNIFLIENDSDRVNYALSLLSSNWRDSFINGIAFSLMSKWHTISRKTRSRLCSYLKEKLVNYNGSARKRLCLADHADYFDDNGPLRLSKLLNSKSMPIEEAPSILGYNPSKIGFEYFSDVIARSIQGEVCKEFTYIDKILSNHNLQRTKKLIAINMVEYADNTMSESIQNSVSQHINTMIGPVTITSTWAPFFNATSEEINKLEESRVKVVKWLAQKVIEVFFELCVRDEARKAYWLKWASVVQDFKIVGSSNVKYKISKDNRLKDVYQGFFLPLLNGKDSTSALILYIKNKVFVEFSETGNALYVYNPSDSVLSNNVTGKSSVRSISSLKIPSLPLAAYKNDWDILSIRDTGRVLHTGDWQGRVNYYMAQKLDLTVISIARQGVEKRQKLITASEWIMDKRVRVIKKDKEFLLEYITDTGDVKYEVLHSYKSKVPDGGRFVIEDTGGYFSEKYSVGYIAEARNYFIGYLSRYNSMNSMIEYSRSKQGQGRYIFIS